ncbi:PQQ-dependent sugar dehydrogenase [Lysobacter korlensis]|uniref:PQQ-dependent sugar dehydrogenase n=1 Tax=Lysobacter korlensis TaxID=553636 RepID=A0ABV6RUM8_9GAMM
MRLGRRALLAGAAVVALAASGCTGSAEPAPSATRTAGPSPTDTQTPTPAEEPNPGVEPTGNVDVLAEGLSIPWSVIPLDDGGALISERNSARVVELTADGEVREAGRVPGVAPGGEGGLLGIALLGEPGDADAWLYAYFTSGPDNRVVRMPLTGDPGSLGLGEPEELLTGLAAAGTHNGGRIKFGPDGMLYVTVGDAQLRDLAQDPEALAGKILRITPEGDVPADNPFVGSPVWSYGHRNPQGIAWDDAGRLWATEFGQNTWDELNLIEPGQNYGWPVVEGRGGGGEFVDPVFQWSPDEASPSGLAWSEGTLFVASLRGQRIWTIDSADGDPQADEWFVGEYGRIRDVVIAPDGSLWFLTNDTGNDRLLRVALVPRDGS